MGRSSDRVVWHLAGLQSQSRLLTRHRLCSSSSLMSEQADRLQERAMQFAVDVCALIKLLPRAEPGPTVRHQLAKSATSVAMNYRSSRRARSHAEFTARIGIV